MATTPIRSREMEYAYFVHALSTRDASMMPVAIDASVLGEYAREGASLFRTRTAGQVRHAGWKLDFGILDADGLLTVTLGDLFALPKKERERLAEHVVAPPLNARFLKLRLGMGACTDEGEIESWDGSMRAAENQG